jgi:hypothetical protein
MYGSTSAGDTAGVAAYAPCLPFTWNRTRPGYFVVPASPILIFVMPAGGAGDLST